MPPRFGGLTAGQEAAGLKPVLSKKSARVWKPAGRLAAFMALLTWMAMIFYASSLSPQEIPKQADSFSWLGRLQSIVFHMGVYGVLGILLMVFLRSWREGEAMRWRLLLGAMAFGALYGVSDEAHQALTPGRSPSLQDVVVDSVGVAAGVALTAAVFRFTARRIASLAVLAALLVAAPLSVWPRDARAQEAPLQPEVMGISLRSPEVSPGEPVRVEAQVRNPSSDTKQFTFVLFVDEAPQEARVASLPPQATRTLRFSVTRAQPGAHVVRLGPRAAAFQVASPEFLLRDLAISPLVVGPGEPVSIQAVVENAGPVPLVYQAPLSINSELVDVRSEFLLVNREALAAFQVARKEPGVYSVQLGPLTGFFIVAGKDMDTQLPAQLALGSVGAQATAATGEGLLLTGDGVTLSYASGVFVATLPVRLGSGQDLGSFEDVASGISFAGGRLTIPLRDELNRVAARVMLTPSSAVTEGGVLRLKGDRIVLEIPETLLRLPLAVTPAAPVSFSMSTSLSAMSPGGPMRLTPSLQPPIASLASLEAAAQIQGKSLQEVIAGVVVEMPGSAGKGEASSVTFGVTQAWFSTVGLLYIGRVGEGGGVEWQAATATPAPFGRVDLRASFQGFQGAFVLARLKDASPPAISLLSVSSPVIPAGSTAEVRAVAGSSPGSGRPLANAVLYVNGTPVGMAAATPFSDGSQGFTFALSPAGPGALTLRVGELQAQLRVGLRDLLGHIQVTEIGATPRSVAPGQPLIVTAKLVNVGDRDLLARLPLEVDGAVVEERLVAVGAGASQEVRFTVARPKEATYEAVLLNRRVRFTVAGEPTPARMATSELTLDATALDPGARVTARFQVANEGDLPGTHVARLFLNAREVERREIALDGLTRMPVAVSVQPPGEGIYTLELDGMRRHLVVLSPLQRADLVVETLELEPATVFGGQPVVANVVIRNRFVEPATSTLYVLVNGQTRAQSALSLGPRGSARRQFLLREDSPGFYEVEMRLGRAEGAIISIYRGQFLVTRAQDEASWEISLLEVLPQPAAPGQPLQVSFLLSNLGQRAGETELVATVDGREEKRIAMSLGPQSTRPVSFALAGRSAGDYTLDVNNVRVRFSVKGPADGVSPDGSAPGVSGGPSGLARGLMTAGGIAAVLALGAGVGGFLVWRRRRDKTPAA
ncbi:MAG: VanZ family protein [Chloroflexi bacterium]|nr:VanZ family protein [Chloroflexota bacterium]